MNYSLVGLGHDVHAPLLVIKVLAHLIQNLRLSEGMCPTEHFLHLSSNVKYSSGWHFEQEFLLPFGKLPSSQLAHFPSDVTISCSALGHALQLLRSSLLKTIQSI